MSLYPFLPEMTKHTKLPYYKVNPHNNSIKVKNNVYALGSQITQKKMKISSYTGLREN